MKLEAIRGQPTSTNLAAATICPYRRFNTRTQVELLQYMLNVNPHGAFGNAQIAGDQLVALAVDQLFKNTLAPIRQLRALVCGSG